MNKLIINTDGGARGNPGPAAIGVVIKNSETSASKTENNVIKIGKYIGATTNNVAEYSALVEALKKAQELKANDVECRLDSELVVKQLNGMYKVKDANMKKLWNQVKTLEKSFKNITYSHVPRVQNKEADAIVNDVLDSLNMQNA